MLCIENWVSSAYRIEQIQFAGGTVLTTSDLSNLTMVGTTGADTLTLWSDTTLADGGAGDDTIVASASKATLLWWRGHDTLTDNGSNGTRRSLGVERRLGFVRKGQSVKIKLAAFTFQKYGMV